jgi:nickel transport system ATP-binding protein
MDIIAEPLRNFDDLTDSQLRRKIDFLLAMVGLEPSDADKYPHQFSGGQLQRICIARALALQPRLVILDEAVSSLDMLIQAQALRLLRRLQQQTGIAYLFVSHDIRIVAGFCDQVAVMHQGRITSTATDLSEAKEADDPILRQLARAVLPAWPEGWTHAENPLTVDPSSKLYTKNDPCSPPFDEEQNDHGQDGNPPVNTQRPDPVHPTESQGRL